MRFVCVGGKGFLQEDMFPGAKGAGGPFVMERIRKGYINCVNIGVIEKVCSHSSVITSVRLWNLGALP